MVHDEQQHCHRKVIATMLKTVAIVNMTVAIAINIITATLAMTIITVAVSELRHMAMSYAVRGLLMCTGML